jgi:hypothetical protein
MNGHPFQPDPDPRSNPVAVPMVTVRDEVRWEYRRILRNLRTEDVPDEADLNALGADGWELVSMVSDSPFLYLLFKRPVW